MVPELSIIIPVFKEQQIIRETVGDLLSLRYPGGMEILVVDGQVPPATNQCLEALAASSPGVVLVSGPKGRGPQMNAGARAARGRIFLFLHADTRMDQTGLDLIRWAASSRGPRVFGAFDLAIASGRPIFTAIARTASLRSRITGVPYGDQAVFMTRRVFESAGGYPDIPLMEDVALMAGLKRVGRGPVIFRHTVSTSARRWESRGIVRTTLTNWVLILLYLAGARPRQLARFY